MTYDLDKASRWERFWRKFRWMQGRKGAAEVAPSALKTLAGMKVSIAIPVILVGGAILVGGYMWWTKDRPDDAPVEPGVNLRDRESERSGSSSGIPGAAPPDGSASVPSAVVHGAGLWRLGQGSTHGRAADVGASAGDGASLKFDLPEFGANFWLEGVPQTLKPGEAFRVTLHGNISAKVPDRAPAALAEVLAEGFGGRGSKAAQVRVVAGQGDGSGSVEGLAPVGGAGQGPRFVLRAWNADRWVVLPYVWESAR